MDWQDALRVFGYVVAPLPTAIIDHVISSDAEETAPVEESADAADQNYDRGIDHPGLIAQTSDVGSQSTSLFADRTQDPAPPLATATRAPRPEVVAENESSRSIVRRGDGASMEIRTNSDGHVTDAIVLGTGDDTQGHYVNPPAERVRQLEWLFQFPQDSDSEVFFEGFRDSYSSTGIRRRVEMQIIDGIRYAIVQDNDSVEWVPVETWDDVYTLLDPRNLY